MARFRVLYSICSVVEYPSTFVEGDETEEAEEAERRASRRALMINVVGDEREANDERARYVNEINVCGQIALQLDSNIKTGVGSLIFHFVCLWIACLGHVCYACVRMCELVFFVNKIYQWP